MHRYRTIAASFRIRRDDKHGISVSAGCRSEDEAKILSPDRPPDFAFRGGSDLWSGDNQPILIPSRARFMHKLIKKEISHGVGRFCSSIIEICASRGDEMFREWFED